MKKTLLFGLAVGLGGLTYAQCDITGLSPIMCLTDAPAAMDVASPGASYTGPGVDGNVFTPAEAGLGTHTIEVTAPGEGYSIDESLPYDPIDITGGSTVSLSDDQVSGDLPMGFDFVFFGNTYSNMRISSNGFVTFPPETDNGCCSGEAMPNASSFEPQNVIAACWEDLRPPSGGTIRYETVGTAPNRICVVEFDAVHHYFSGFPVTFRIQMYETTNCIEIHLQNQDATGNHTLGIQNEFGDEAYVAPGKNGSPWTASNFAIAFCPNVGCTGSMDVEVVAAPNVDGSADVEEICLGEEITLTADGTADSYSWGASIEDGVPFAPEITGENVFIVAGTDDATGCIATSLVTVFVHDIPYVYAGDDFTVCADDEFTLEAVGDEADYSWDMGATDGVPMMQDAGTVTYTVTATNAGDCEATSSINVEALEVPTGDGIVTMMTGDAYDGEIDFTPSGGTGGPYTFLWSNGETTEDISALGVGTYTVTVSDGFCDSDVTFTVDSQAGVALNELDNLKVYPNPVIDNVTIEFEGTYNWTLYDNTGKIVAQGQATGKELVSMEELAAGNYVVKVEVDGKVSNVSLVKE